MPSPSPPADLSRRQSALALSALVAVAAALYVLGIRWGVFQHEPTWAWDEILPTHVRAGWQLLYPPAHHYLLLPLYDLVEWSGLARFPAAGGLGPVVAWMLASRLLTVAMACATLVLFYRAARRLFPRSAAIFAVGCVAFGTNYVFYAKTANLDVPYVFWFAAALLFFYRALGRGRARDLVCFAVAAALSTATKDQAGGLFLLAPLPLVWSRRRQLGTSWWRAALRPEMLAAGAAGAAVYLLIFGEPWSGLLLDHVAALRSLPYEHYRTWELSPAGLAEMLGLTLRNLVFVSGWPVVLAGFAGLVLALRAPRRDAALLSSLFLALPYWVVFIGLSGFDYDRHYLPLSLVLALFAARAFDALARPAGARRLRPALAAALLVYLALRGLSVDLMLRGDARYAAAEWLAEEGLTEETLGLGEAQSLPWGIARASMKRFRPRRVGEHGYNPDVWHDCQVLDGLDAEYLVPESPELFTTPGLNYREIRRFPNAAPFSVIDWTAFPDYYSNVVKAARDVVVFARTGEPCVDLDPLAVALQEIASGGVPERARRLARDAFEDPMLSSRPIGLGDIRLLRVDERNRTLGRMPAGVAVRNRGVAPRETDVWVEIEGGERFPVTVTIDSRGSSQRIVFERPEIHQTSLAPVAPGEHRLFVVRADPGWYDTDATLRGARLRFRGAGAEAAHRRAELDRLLVRLARQRDPAVRAALRDAIAEKTLDVDVVEVEGARLAGVTRKARTRGATPAALVVTNDRARARTALLQLSAGGEEGEPAARLVVDDGERHLRHRLPRSRVARIPLGRVEGGSRRLFLLWTEGPPDAGDPSARPGLRIRGVGQQRPRDDRGASGGAGGH